MKKNLFVAVAAVLLIANLAAAQAPSAPQGQPPKAPQTQPPAQQPAGPQTGTQTPGTPPAGAPAEPAQKPLPQAKTQEEYAAFMEAVNKTEPAAAEAAAREFEIKYPQSELLSMLYQQVMTKYQRADNGDKMVEMARKSLQYDPENVAALILTATVVAERTRETDIDRDQRLNEVMKNAQHAISNVSSGNFRLAPGTTPEQTQMFKDLVLAWAYGAMGYAELTRNNPPAAEQQLRKAVQTNVGGQEAIYWYRLALALDKQKKYAEALPAVDKAVQLAGTNAQIANLARAEQDRLRKLTGSGASGAAPGGGTAGTAAPAPTTGGTQSGEQPQKPSAPTKPR
jgi:tetratricopeptide (TPR) repeat protein